MLPGDRKGWGSTVPAIFFKQHGHWRRVPVSKPTSADTEYIEQITHQLEKNTLQRVPSVYSFSPFPMPIVEGVVTVLPVPSADYVVDFDNPQRQAVPHAYWIAGAGTILSLLMVAQRLYTKFILMGKVQVDDGKSNDPHSRMASLKQSLAVPMLLFFPIQAFHANVSVFLVLAWVGRQSVTFH